MNEPQLIHPTGGGHWVLLDSLDIMNSGIVNICVHFVGYKFLLAILSRSRITES